MDIGKKWKGTARTEGGLLQELSFFFMPREGQCKFSTNVWEV